MEDAASPIQWDRAKGADRGLVRITVTARAGDSRADTIELAVHVARSTGQTVFVTHDNGTVLVDERDRVGDVEAMMVTMRERRAGRGVL